MGKLSRDATDEGAKSDIAQIGAHSSVAYGATFPILGKATTRVRTHRQTPIYRSQKTKKEEHDVFLFFIESN